MVCTFVYRRPSAASWSRTGVSTRPPNGDSWPKPTSSRTKNTTFGAPCGRPRGLRPRRAGRVGRAADDPRERGPRRVGGDGHDSPRDSEFDRVNHSLTYSAPGSRSPATGRLPRSSAAARRGRWTRAPPSTGSGCENARSAHRRHRPRPGRCRPLASGPGVVPCAGQADRGDLQPGLRLLLLPGQGGALPGQHASGWPSRCWRPTSPNCWPPTAPPRSPSPGKVASRR